MSEKVEEKVEDYPDMIVVKADGMANDEKNCYIFCVDCKVTTANRNCCHSCGEECYLKIIPKTPLKNEFHCMTCDKKHDSIILKSKQVCRKCREYEFSTRQMKPLIDTEHAIFEELYKYVNNQTDGKELRVLGMKMIRQIDSLVSKDDVEKLKSRIQQLEKKVMALEKEKEDWRKKGTKVLSIFNKN